MSVAARDFGRWRGSAVAHRVYRRRTDLGLGQKDVVQRLYDRVGMEVSVGGYSNWERSGTTDLAFLEALAIVLDCSVAYLVGWTSRPKNHSPDRPLTAILQENETRASLRAVPSLSPVQVMILSRRGRESSPVQPPIVSVVGP